MTNDIITLVSELPNEISKKFVLRSMIGVVNGALVGALGSVIRKKQPEEASGVDGYNEMEADGTLHTEIAGLEPHADMYDVARDLISLRDYLLTGPGGSYPEADLPSALGETIDFMVNREVSVGEKALEALSLALGVPVSDLEQARKAMIEQDKAWLKEHRAELLDLEQSITPFEQEAAFDRLPAKYRLRIYDRTVKAIEKQTQFAIQAVLRGKMAAASEVTLNRDIITQMGQWAAIQASSDPAFREAQEQAA